MFLRTCVTCITVLTVWPHLLHMSQSANAAPGALPARPQAAAALGPPTFRPQLPQFRSAPPAGPPPAEWTEHTAPDGRPYFYNARLKKSSWERPAELMTAATAAQFASSPDWGEFVAVDGRKYYYNRATKQSRWDLPNAAPTASTASSSGHVGAPASGPPTHLHHAGEGVELRAAHPEYVQQATRGEAGEGVRQRRTQASFDSGF